MIISFDQFFNYNLQIIETIHYKNILLFIYFYVSYQKEYFNLKHGVFMAILISFVANNVKFSNNVLIQTKLV